MVTSFGVSMVSHSPLCSAATTGQEPRVDLSGIEEHPSGGGPAVLCRTGQKARSVRPLSFLGMAHHARRSLLSMAPMCPSLGLALHTMQSVVEPPLVLPALACARLRSLLAVAHHGHLAHLSTVWLAHGHGHELRQAPRHGRPRGQRDDRDGLQGEAVVHDPLGRQ